MYSVQPRTGPENPDSCAVPFRGESPETRRSGSDLRMKCRTYLAGFAVLVALGAYPCFGASAPSVSGVVRDSSGVPQIGAEVQLLGPNLTVIASVYTNAQGRFLISALKPGHYALKATGPSFLPSQRENVRVHSSTVVNLTLYTLYEVIQWLPAQPRSGKAPKDDWAWTLRSAANRPLLRWLEDGPLIVDSDGAGAKPKLKARILATGQAGTFGENGERFSAAVENTPSTSRELLARVDFAPGTNAGMESMLGFRQDLGMAGSVESVAAVSVAPQVVGGAGAGLGEASIRSSETMYFGDSLEANVGSDTVAGRLAGSSLRTVSAMLPFATVAWHNGASTIQYRLATMVPDPDGSINEATAWMPAVAERDGALTIARGLHQEISWARDSGASGMSLVVFSDRVDNPVLEAQGQFVSGYAPTAVLFDRASSLMRAAGPSYGSTGIEASFEHSLPGNRRVRLSYASGNSLVMPALPQASALADVLASPRSRRAETYAISLSGTLDGTGTRWRASYSWQPDNSVTPVTPFAQDAVDPYLNLYFRQPIRIAHDNSVGLEALVDMRNLLAQGYRPFILSDGSLLFFAQSQRALCAGLSFTF